MTKFLKIVALSAICGVAGTANAANLMDQIGSNPNDLTGTAASSQQFESGSTQFNINAIDDFTLGGANNVTQVEAVIAFFNSSTNDFTHITGYNVDVFSSVNAAASSFTGDVFHGVVAPGSATVNGGYAGNIPHSALVSLPVSINLAAGTYWIGIEPILNFSTDGQVGIEQSNYGAGFPNGANAYQTNANGGFGLPGNRQQIVDPATGAGQNLAYRITGSPVPEPVSFVILGLGLVGLVARRRK